MKTLLMAVCAAIMGVVLAEDGVLWVDDDNFEKPGLDGQSAETAFGTIQDAVNAAEAEGSGITTIKVLPGTYDQGGKTFSYTYKADASGSLKGQTRNLLNRVFISKKLTLLATSDDPADTHIVGARDPDPEDGNTWGIGPDAIRCVYSEASGVIIKGFTIRDGASQAITAEGDVAAGYPGSVYGGTNDRRCFLVDCVVSNCVGTRACCVRRCTAVRTLFSDNTAYAGNAPGRDSSFFHCVIRRCSSTFMSCTVVNTTCVETPNAVATQSADQTLLYNSLFAAYAGSMANDKAYCNVVMPGFEILEGGEGENNLEATYPIIAPLMADYRPLAGSGAESLARISYLKAKAEPLNAPELVEIYKSMDGVTIDPDSTDPIAAGAYQKSATAATGGIQYADTTVETDGYLTSRPGLWAFSETTPRILTTTLRNGGADLFAVERASDCGGVAYPKDGNAFCQPFPPVGLITTNTGKFVTRTYYVDPDEMKGKDDANEEGRGLSSEKPFLTLQYAIDRVSPKSTDYVQIFAAAGHYDEGGEVLLSHNARVAIDRKRIRLIGAGVGQSFIEGAEDTTESKADDDSGRGPNAVRCVAVNDENDVTRVNIRGFTVQDGYSSYDPSAPTANGSAYNGGLVYLSANAPVVFSDCEFRRGRAYRASLVNGGRYERCRFTDAQVMAGGAIRDSAQLYFCQVDDITQFNKTGGVACDSGTALYYSTVVMSSKSDASSPVGGLDGIKMYDSVVVGNRTTKFSEVKYLMGGTLLDKFTSYPAVKPGEKEFVVGDPIFVNAAEGDCRVADFSPAITAGAPSADWWKGPVHDFGGRPMRFRDGKTVSGAFQYPVQTVVVAPTASYPGAGISNVGTNFVEEGDSLTVTAQAATGRPLLGFKVNGEEVRSAVNTYTVTAPTDGTLAPVALAAWYQTDWYVDAAKKDTPSAGDGFTPETAKGTLKAAMTELPLAAGDTVHAAAGTYRDGDMEPAFVNSAPSTIHSRVVVPDGVTLVADEGPAETVIEGSSPNGSGNRFSVNAIRCASVCAKGILKGFTILGGQTMDNATAGKTVNGGQDDGCGGGVLAASGGTIVGCVITNCCACRGGGASGNGAKYVNTEFRCNSASATSSAAYYGEFFGCFLDGNVNAGGQVVRFCTGLHNCTVTENNYGSIEDFHSDRMIENSIVLRQINIQSGTATVTNTIYSSFGARTPVDAGGNVAGVSTAADAGLDAAYRPVKDGLAMDSGDNALVSNLFDGLDLAGGQRIYNGTVDRGCYEYDWRGDYATDLGGNATVAAADPQVVETDQKKVLVRDGALKLRFRDDSLRAKYAIPFEVTGTGVLTLTAGDEIIGTYTATDGAQNLIYRNKTYGNDLAFTYEPGENDDGGALLDAISGGVSGLLLMLR